MAFTGILALVFAAFVLFFIGALSLATDKRRLREFNDHAMEGNATAAEQELSVPFSDRILRPATNVLGRTALRFSPVGMIEGIKKRLVMAGSPASLSLDSFLALKALASLVTAMLVAGIVIIRMTLSLQILIGGVLIIVVAFFVPDLWLRSKIGERQKAIRRALPDTLDLLTISVEAGLGFDSALSKVVSNTKGPLSEEFFRMLQEIQLGIPRAQAFRNLGERTGVPELESFIIAMLQADIFGISVGKVLRIQAKEMRVKRRQQAEEIAQKAPVKIVFPLILCIFPALLVVVLGPAAISIYKALAGGF